jgi:hypothetical protein
MTQDAQSMIRTLVLIAIAGFVTSAICFAAAASFGGPDLFRHNWGWHFDDEDEVYGEGGRDWRDASPTPSTIEMPWNSDSLVIDVPAEVRFTQAAGESKVVVSGPSDLVNELRVEGGRLTGLDEDGPRRLTIAITAPRITDFVLDGESTLIIEGYDQDRLTLDVGGRADVSARGKARALTLHVHDRADADLGGLTAEDVVANVRSNGELNIAPTDEASLTVTDQGKVTLMTRPRQVSSDVTDDGKVIQAGAAEAPAAPAPPPAPKAPDATS